MFLYLFDTCQPHPHLKGLQSLADPKQQLHTLTERNFIFTATKKY